MGRGVGFYCLEGWRLSRWDRLEVVMLSVFLYVLAVPLSVRIAFFGNVNGWLSVADRIPPWDSQAVPLPISYHPSTSKQPRQLRIPPN